MYTNSKGTRGQTQPFITVCLCEFVSGCEMWLLFSKALTNEDSLRKLSPTQSFKPWCQLQANELAMHCIQYVYLCITEVSITKMFEHVQASIEVWKLQYCCFFGELQI